jgi:hypothetical protein
MTHHPHVHGIVPGGGLSLDGQRWQPCKPGFFLSVRVLSRLFRRLFLEKLDQAHRDDELQCFGELQSLKTRSTFERWLKAQKKTDWVVYAKAPFAGPEAVLAYLSRYTHRVAISNSRLLSFDGDSVTFRWKDYRNKKHVRHKTMTLSSDEFIRRFLIHVLPSGFHRIRHYGLLANSGRRDNLKKARALLQTPCEEPRQEKAVTENTASQSDHQEALPSPTFVCRACGHPMVVIECLLPSHLPRAPPTGIRR